MRMNRESKLSRNCEIILSLVGRHMLHVLAAYLMTEYVTNNSNWPHKQRVI